MRLRATEVKQGSTRFYLFKCKASELWGFSQINQRQEDKDEGYQRVLSRSRVQKLKDFVASDNAIPGAIIVSFDRASYGRGMIEIPDVEDAGWIIDGQHRAAGAERAAREGHDIELAVVGFIGLTIEEQTDYFVTINREAKGVPSSLYIDLLKQLPRRKTEKERLEERIADISKILTRDPESVFYERIVSTTSPTSGQVSLTNFARKTRPILHPTTGILGTYALPEQGKIIENYFRGIKSAFPKSFSQKVFFRTLGFGAMWRAFPLVFSASLNQSGGGFTVHDVAHVLGRVPDFEFDEWKRLGSGSAAEIQAGDDIVAELKDALEAEGDTGSAIRL